MKIFFLILISLIVFNAYPQDNPLDLNDVTSEDLNSDKEKPMPNDNDNSDVIESTDQKGQDFDPAYISEPALIEDD